VLPGERLLLPIITHDKREFSRPPSSLEQMLRLTRASNPDEIGKFGPSVAALAFEATALANPPAGTPAHLRLYEVNFGRDSLRVAIDLISSYPELARATTLRLAELQGLEDNTEREEELGRIVHEARDEDDPIARDLTERLGWGWPYYGSVDATPEFIRTLTAYCQRSEENRAFLSQEFTDRQGNRQTMAHALEMALAWITRRLSSNPEGLLEYKSVLPKGIENQVWKDSWDAYHHADGTLANHDKGIASIEVQVTTYDALIDAAELFEDVLDYDERAQELRAHAEQLKRTILGTFWTEEKDGYFVLGTDRDDHGQLRQLKIRTSNMGHTLNSRLLKGDDPETVRMREAVVRHILSPELLNVSGIRTLASDEVRFRAGSYHCGSVWLWDTHHIAKGLRRLGYGEAADDLDRRILNVTTTTRVFPEYVRGDDSDTPSINQQTIIVWDEVNQRENKVVQPPQEVQAWSVAVILATQKRLARRGVDLSTYSNGLPTV
ncbi:MAG TPA: amylo-alpha-1,6-glucosidase, partial [Candidatus Saccharimonadales bacterium]|nr:amylo-alpha-1,6-glucosidase [Candidatus Saccharimonadales bacterium]